MKRRTKIILSIVALLVSGGIYASYNFTEDKGQVEEIMVLLLNDDIQEGLAALERNEGFANPLINFRYQKIRADYLARFVDQTEIIENSFGSEVAYDIANIYRNYWRKELLKTDERRSDV